MPCALVERAALEGQRMRLLPFFSGVKAILPCEVGLELDGEEPPRYVCFSLVLHESSPRRAHIDGGPKLPVGEF